MLIADETPRSGDRTYTQIMQDQQVMAELDRVERALADKHASGELEDMPRPAKKTNFLSGESLESVASSDDGQAAPAPGRRKKIALSAAAIAAVSLLSSYNEV